jgi:signal transduction histidine kinase/streptogramin lyase
VLLRDRQGALWIGTQDQGLYHVHDGRTDRFSRGDGLSGDTIYGLYEDREGNVWVSTLNGLDRFREFAVATLSKAQGIPGNIYSVLGGADGSVWIGTSSGLARWRNGKSTFTPLPGRQGNAGAESLFEDNSGRLWISSLAGLSYLESERFTAFTAAPVKRVPAMVQDTAGDIWISEQDLGLIHLRGERLLDVTPWSRMNKRIARSMTPDPSDGGLWLGFFQGGISYFKDGEIRASYAVADGLGSGSVTGLQVDRDGIVWAATQSGLSRLSHGKILTLTRANGLPCSAVNWVIRDSAASLWLYAECGLIRITSAEIDAWARDPRRVIQFTVYGALDGNPNHADTGNFSPKVSLSADGKLWFVSFEGAGVIDPAHIPFNALKPPVHIEQVTADTRSYDPASQLRLPPRVRDLRIDYTALSLALPEKVLFRYKLEGRDEDWIDAGTRRQAFYSDLGPSEYRFRVMASNNDGVWNQEGSVISVVIPPAWFQTVWFRTGVVLTLLFTFWMLARLRWHRLAAELNARFEERLDERTRIAQELHDTLLQGLLSISMQLNVLTDEIKDAHVNTKMSGILKRIGQVIDEGRRTLHGLRSHYGAADALEQAISRDADDFRGRQDVDIHIVTEGARRSLNPLVGDDVYCITREAVVNALRHSRARRVDIGIEYGRQHLRVTVADDGCGIDPQILERHKPGHFGIRGMRERAERIGATVRFWSRDSAGTEVELVVPETVFQRTGPRPRARWWRLA